MPLNLGLDRDTMLLVTNYMLGLDTNARFGRVVEPVLAVTLQKNSAKDQRFVSGTTRTQCFWLRGEGWTLSYVRREKNGKYSIDWNYNLAGDEEAFRADWLLLTLALQ